MAPDSVRAPAVNREDWVDGHVQEWHTERITLATVSGDTSEYVEYETVFPANLYDPRDCRMWYVQSLRMNPVDADKDDLREQLVQNAQQTYQTVVPNVPSTNFFINR
ncbi:hypothetical protein RB195_017529 [Necator americanus]|uniref:Uncharacterized protein n=1 Tax=Necator americanus TaxID=51031 RepID=A0ABR1C8N9_NECAM